MYSLSRLYFFCCPAIDLLIEYGVIEDKGSIKENYDTYLHPDTLEYNDYKMWNDLDENKIIDAFQFDTPMGKQVIKVTQPRSVLELSTANSLMRLMAQDDASEAPMDTYKRYKDNIDLWYQEMKRYGLNKKEIEIMKKHLGKLYGVADTQESIMELSMDNEISGFDVVGANKLRKAVAKKKAALVNEMREKFFKHGKELNTREELLHYVWDVQIKRQLGYSFSMNHCMPYTIICLQTMNNVEKYGPLFWNCGCLSINSGGGNEEELEEKGTDYGKIAKAMGNMYKSGIKIVLPDINKAKIGFSPNKETNEIIYGLKAIQGIGNAVVNAIIENRPYTSMLDFYNKMQVYKNASEENKFGDSAMIALIKAGCFDRLENKDRREIMRDFISIISSPLKRLTTANIETLNSYGLLTDAQKKYELRLFRFRKWAYKEEFLEKQAGKSPSTFYYRLDRRFSEPYFIDNFIDLMTEDKDYYYNEEGYIVVKRGGLDKVIDKLLEDFKKKVLENPDVLEKVNQIRIDTLWEEKCPGTISKWEMDSLCYYYSEHELKDVEKSFYNIYDFYSLPENPVIADTYMYRGIEKSRFALVRICGTVIDKNKDKNVVTLLTETGVVDVKFYKGQFSFYNKRISEIQNDGTSKVMEDSWF